MKLLRVASISAFVIAALGVLIAPATLHDGYSVLTNSISESAAQYVSTAWIARTALFTSGAGVLAVVVLKASTWSRTVRISFTAFGLLWIISSMFSTKSWVAGTPYNPTENAIHSYAASAMAIVVLGALALGFSKHRVRPIDRILDIGLAAAATFLPLASLLAPEFAGIFQRLMSFYTYFWFGRQVKLT